MLWSNLIRVKTLPLSLAPIFIATALILQQEKFDKIIFFLSLGTSFFLQIISNLANDYGDGTKGLDVERVGPSRYSSRDKIIRKKIVFSLMVCIVINIFLGGILLLYSFRTSNVWYVVVFCFIGICSLLAAIFYTVGKRPYGYRALGDIAVFIFFGLVGVLGNTFLYDKNIQFIWFLPAIALGFFMVGVLNINNIRDRENDKKYGKLTIAVLLGEHKSKIYQNIILGSGILLFITYSILTANNPVECLYWLAFLGIFHSMYSVSFYKKKQLLNKELAKLSFSIFFLAVLFIIGIGLSKFM